MADEGYILSNKFRRIIFEGFTSGETRIERIAKKHRIILRVAQKVVEDFINENIIEESKKGYILTDEGKKLEELLKG